MAMICCLVAAPLLAAPPAWWAAFSKMPPLESRFRQESESAVFGKVVKEGRLALARGGRLRVVYDGGLMVTCDGRHLVQYDPDTRTAQKIELVRAVRDFPLLGMLLDPARLEKLYRIDAFGGETVKLTPRETGLPELKATGRKGLLHAVEWTDPSGARQRMELLNPKSPATLSPDTFKAQVPTGARWSTPNG
ncbi:MAG: outer-membrane lipoprotein carrier protein LolA [Acidobacteria bacterium]|nr:outer-membrane lipoprotein carrier protein LolA [Acidobacteriota bacterium]MBI3489471.1 outer-membrane lipoprotein carrier protein LolA [Acidobacteriota bacterium]